MYDFHYFDSLVYFHSSQHIRSNSAVYYFFNRSTAISNYIFNVFIKCLDAWNTEGNNNLRWLISVYSKCVVLSWEFVCRQICTYLELTAHVLPAMYLSDIINTGKLHVARLMWAIYETVSLYHAPERHVGN